MRTNALLGFSVESVLSAESAVLVELYSVRRVLLVLHGVVVTLFALCAGKSNFDSHSNGTSDFIWPPSFSIPDCLISGKEGHKKSTE